MGMSERGPSSGREVAETTKFAHPACARLSIWPRTAWDGPSIRSAPATTMSASSAIPAPRSADWAASAMSSPRSCARSATEVRLSIAPSEVRRMSIPEQSLPGSEWLKWTRRTGPDHSASTSRRREALPRPVRPTTAAAR
ncbi:Uncharacterised protein [Mycobacteroides abscessus subsp. abscessus]|nr:Uncharacterised protein [Mycobacteroides abscessus subsp. abscessus]